MEQTLTWLQDVLSLYLEFPTFNVIDYPLHLFASLVCGLVTRAVVFSWPWAI